MSKNECKIQLLDFYFSKFDFLQKREESNEEYSTTFKIDYSVNSADDSMIRVAIDTSIKNATETILINLETVGTFKIDKTELDEETYDHLIKINTVAIMFPYIRSQISIITTQPGIPPIMLPPMNINALIDSCEENW